MEVVTDGRPLRGGRSQPSRAPSLPTLKCGWGGDTRIAGLLGIDSGTVARGRRQLLAQDVERQRVRRPRWRAAKR